MVLQQITKDQKAKDQKAEDQKAQAQLLSDMAEAIVAVASPEKIILFGSRARGTSGPHSDYDFLIVDADPFGAERSRRKAAAKIWRALRPFEIPADVLIYTPEEVDYWSQSLNHVVACAMREGKVLYERFSPNENAARRCQERSQRALSDA